MDHVPTLRVLAPTAEVQVVDTGSVNQCVTCSMFVLRPDTHSTTQTCRQIRQQRANKEAAKQQTEAELVRFYVNRRRSNA